MEKPPASLKKLEINPLFLRIFALIGNAIPTHPAPPDKSVLT
jgi:hypothetical protein